MHKKVSELAHLDGISPDQFIAIAIAEKLSAFMTLNWLRNRADRSSEQSFQEALSEIPDTDPEEYDRL
ncbi:MAG: hypothetical protein AB7S75_25675 [Desulfococcaceae bacterium]